MRSLRQLIILLLLTSAAFAANYSTFTGAFSKISGTAITSGKVVFTLKPGKDTTISGITRFSPQAVTCLITGTGLKAADGVSACTIAKNTVLTPGGTFYKVDICPLNACTSTFNTYAITDSVDITTAVPTPDSIPNYSIVDVFSDQSIAGHKTFTDEVDFTGTVFVKSLNNVAFCDQFAGADAGAKLNAAIASLDITIGGFVDCRGLVGSQSSSSVITVDRPVTIAFGAVTFDFTTSTDSWNVQAPLTVLGGGCTLTHLRATGTHKLFVVQSFNFLLKDIGLVGTPLSGNQMVSLETGSSQDARIQNVCMNANVGSLVVGINVNGDAGDNMLVNNTKIDAAGSTAIQFGTDTSDHHRVISDSNFTTSNIQVGSSNGLLIENSVFANITGMVAGTSKLKLFGNSLNLVGAMSISGSELLWIGNRISGSFTFTNNLTDSVMINGGSTGTDSTSTSSQNIIMYENGVQHKFTLLENGTAPSGVAGSFVEWADSGDHFKKFKANNGAVQNFPQIIALASDYTNSTTTMSTVTGFSFPVNANTNYTAVCHLFYQSAATGGLNVQFIGPAAPTSVIYGLNSPLSATTFTNQVATAFTTSIGTAVTTAATNFDAIISFDLFNGANAGSVQLQAKSSAAVTLTIKAGSFCRIQ
jgi:hypothetical protein